MSTINVEVTINAKDIARAMSNEELIKFIIDLESYGDWGVTQTLAKHFSEEWAAYEQMQKGGR